MTPFFSPLSIRSNKSRTLPFENRKNIAVIALSPDARLLLSVDDDGRAILVHFRRGIVLHRIHFKKPVTDVQFSPDGKCVASMRLCSFLSLLTFLVPHRVKRYIAVTHDTHVQVWRTPNHLVREFAPFVLHRTYTGHRDEVLTIHWAPDSTCVLHLWFCLYSPCFFQHVVRSIDALSRRPGI